jgi:hypothetical protein
MEIWYTSRSKFTPEHFSWSGYIEWSGLKQVTEELITLDTNLCESSFAPDLEDKNTYDTGITTPNGYFAYCYKNIGYVLANTPLNPPFNLLAVTLNPETECQSYTLEGFRFIGYDLIDLSNDTSSVTNCGGFDGVFSSDVLNTNGLIKDLDTSNRLAQLIYKNNPDEYHADTNVWGVWIAV